MSAEADLSSAFLNGQTKPPAGACNSCRRRKLKCDKKLDGCANCAKGQISCIYPSSSPKQVKRKRGPYQKNKTQREKQLEHTVRDMASKYAELENRILPRRDSSVNHDFTPPSGESSSEGLYASTLAAIGSNMSSRQGVSSSVSSSIDGDLALPHFPQSSLGCNPSGKDTPLSNRFWTPFSKDFVQVTQAVDESSSALHNSNVATPEQVTSGPSSGIASASPVSDLRSLHPSVTDILECWRIYTMKVEPMIRLLHPPSFERRLLAAISDLDHVTGGMELLMFSICFAAVTCISPEDVQLQFYESKENLLKKSKYAIRKAMVDVNFMASRDIQTLQGLVIYLLLLRHQDDEDVLWTLTGTAVRMAQLMDLSNDSPRLKLSPFEVQMRRRLWWTICRLDLRTAEAYGLQPSLLETRSRDTLPLNVNDLDLYPEAIEAPAPRTGITDMTLPLVGYEITRLVSTINIPDSYDMGADGADARMNQAIARKMRMVGECQTRLQSDYLQYANPSGPFDWMTTTFTRLMLTKCTLLIYHPLNGAATRPLTPEVKDQLFSASIDTVQYSHALKFEPRIEKWAWFFRGFVQWHALAYVAAELGHRTGTSEVDRAWKVLNEVLENKHATTKGSDKSALWKPMHWLIQRAREVRVADLKSRTDPSSATMFDACGGETRSDLTNVGLAEANFGDIAEVGVSEPQTSSLTPSMASRDTVNDGSNSFMDFVQASDSNKALAFLPAQAPNKSYAANYPFDSSTAPVMFDGSNSNLANVDVTGVLNDFSPSTFQDLMSDNQQPELDLFEQLSSENWMDLARSWDMEF
ncbi:hypothetical protein D6C85_04417 [Aureobasidium pullulans]|uniref:Zn(2)-C6 fungal-type domain-containing protein n=1 Tax=Aureobasidium pullulans TaxID=5580 RepID=A0A4S9X382_AURPU|nr:hypothetical protein D6C85_04417 [Aureobasidium pullulans]